MARVLGVGFRVSGVGGYLGLLKGCLCWLKTLGHKRFLVFLCFCSLRFVQELSIVSFCALKAFF